MVLIYTHRAYLGVTWQELWGHRLFYVYRWLMNPLTTIYMQYRTIYDIVNIVTGDVLVRPGPTPSLDATLILIYPIFSGCYVARNEISDT